MTNFQISSPVFENNGFIPERYTFYHENISPPLKWSGIPEGTKSLALIMFDPIAKTPGFVHWVFYNIPPVIEGLEENIEKTAIVPGKGAQGLNGKGDAEYRGCGPGPGPAHPYHFHLYALDLDPSLPVSMDAATLRERIKDHVLAENEIIGMYQQT